jgi:hypothetical protein
LLRPLVKYWRNAGIRIVVYLDDGWGINKDFASASEDALFVKLTLQKAGFINFDKSIFVHVQIIEWLGYVWDLQTGFLRIPERRLQNTLFFYRICNS